MLFILSDLYIKPFLPTENYKYVEIKGYKWEWLLLLLIDPLEKFYVYLCRI